MDYKQVSELNGGERIKVWQNGEYQKATFMRHVRGADPAAWIAFDNQQVAGSGMRGTKVYTGLQFTEEYWTEKNQSIPVFLAFTEEELNAELLESLEVVG